MIIRSSSHQRADFFPVFPCTAADGATRAILYATDIDNCGDGHYHHRWWVTDSYGDKHLVRFGCGGSRSFGGVSYCLQCQPEQMLFYAHKCCWKVANSPEITPALKWLRMAIQTRPFGVKEGFPEEGINYDEGNDLLALDGSFFSRDTDLGKLALRLSTMPLEVQKQVLDDLDDSMFFSLLKSRSFSWQILPRIRASTTVRPTMRVLDTEAPIRSIYVRRNNILGRSYITEVGFNNEVNDGLSSIPISDVNVRGCRFALGKFGLRGLQIKYDDGSCSPWLGDRSSCWTGSVHGRDLSKLRVIADVSSPRMDI